MLRRNRSIGPCAVTSKKRQGPDPQTLPCPRSRVGETEDR